MSLIAEQRRERQERILSAVRRMIAERGFEGVTIRELARESRVSVPTLYKLIGGKDALLFAAVESHYSALLAGVDAESGGVDRLFSIVDAQCDELQRTSRYSRALLGVFSGANPRAHALTETIVHELTSEFANALGQMSEERQLASWVEPRVLAQRLAAQCTACTLSWATDHLSNEGLRATMTYSVCLVLLGVARGRATRRLEQAAREAQGGAAWHPARGRQTEGESIDADGEHRSAGPGRAAV